MPKFLILLIISFAMNYSVKADSCEPTKINGFAKFIADYPSLDTSMVWDIKRLNSVSLGDAGEATNPELYIKQYFSKIDYLDSVFTKTELIQIVLRNYDPLVSAYAYQALIDYPFEALSDSIFIEIFDHFASDTVSEVSIDYGCYRISMPLIEFLLGVSVKQSYCGIYYRNHFLVSKETLYHALESYHEFCKWQTVNFHYTPWEDWQDFSSHFKL